MTIAVLPLLFALGVSSADVGRVPASSVTEQTFAATAARLVPAYESSQDAQGLTTLVRLQLASGRLTDAGTSLDRLEAVYRSSEPRMVPSLIPWRVYVRAQALEAGGETPSQAFARAFSEVYGALPDVEAAAAFPWFSIHVERLRAAESKLVESCKGMALQQCPSAAAYIGAHEALLSLSYVGQASAPLLAADTRRRYLVDDQVLVPTPDGAQIAAIVVRPRSQGESRLTTLLNFTIYARDYWSISDAVGMAAHGYAGVVAYTLGKGRSPGTAVPYVHDADDAATVINWLARQPWSDGRVGMFSGSYNGFTQWAAANRHPTALKAIATHATNAPGIDTPMQGNVFQSFIYPWPFYTTDTKGLDDALYEDHARWASLERKWYVSGRPYRDMDKIDGKPNPIFDEWLQHPSYDAYWRRLLPYGHEFAGIDIPVFVQTGYYDGGMVGALYYLEQHLAYRPFADHRILMGPYHHTAMQTGVLAKVDGYEVDQAALINLQDVRLAWFDHVFRGAPLPALLSDRVNFEVMGANMWRHVHTLGEMATDHARFYLTGRAEQYRLHLDSKPEGRVTPKLVVDLAYRGDADFQPPAGAPDMRNALVFETRPLTNELEVDGLFQGHFNVTINKRDFDLWVRVYAWEPDGQYLALASYLGRVSYMQDRTRRQLLTPGVPHVLDFQSQTATSRLLPPGSRIVAVVGIPKVPDIQINYGTGADVSSESVDDAKEPLCIQWASDSYLEFGTRPLARP